MSKKEPDIFLIIAIILAAAIIAGAVIYASMQAQNGSAPDVSSPQSERVSIPDGMKTCRDGQGCIVVDRHCGLCCDFEPINALHNDLFDQMFSQSCDNYRGEVCSCFDLSSYPACVDGRCALIKWPDER